MALLTAETLLCLAASFLADHRGSRVTQDQHNPAAVGLANTVPARTKRHSPVRGGAAGSMVNDSELLEFLLDIYSF